jgi:uncharacterized protein (TIGR02246 family)
LVLNKLSVAKLISGQILPKMEPMKIRLPSALIALALSFAVPTFAQAQNTVEPEVRQQLEAAALHYDEAWNKHDAAAIAALYTEDAIRLIDNVDGTVSVGREAIAKEFAGYFAASLPLPQHKITQIYAIEDREVVTAEWSQGILSGHTVSILFRDADAWKIRMQFVTLTHSPKTP